MWKINPSIKKKKNKKVKKSRQRMIKMKVFKTNQIKKNQRKHPKFRTKMFKNNCRIKTTPSSSLMMTRITFPTNKTKMIRLSQSSRNRKKRQRLS